MRALVYVVLVLSAISFLSVGSARGEELATDVVELPARKLKGTISVEEALNARRSTRSYAPGALTVAEVGQLLWAAQGITSGGTRRTAPSAGALYPLEVYLIAGDVEGIAAGVYRYDRDGHKLALHVEGDRREALSHAANGQNWVQECAAVIVLTGIYGRTTVKYGERGVRYVHIEVGHSAQNVYLEAVAVGLGTLMVGAFHDEAVAEELGLPQDERPLALMPVGRR